jgi:ABC-type glycerol-3-phosphate transport system substrate-binding protein
MWRLLGYVAMAITAASAKEKQQAAMKLLAYATGTDTVFWSQNTGYMPVRTAAVSSQEMKTFFESHPNFKTTVDQLPKTRPQDSAASAGTEWGRDHRQGPRADHRQRRSPREGVQGRG